MGKSSDKRIPRKYVGIWDLRKEFIGVIQVAGRGETAEADDFGERERQRKEG